jgi:cell division protease FtsH
MAAFLKTLMIMIMLAFGTGVGLLFYHLENKSQSLSYNEFLESLENNEIAEVHFKGSEIALTDNFGRQFTTYAPDVPELLPKLLAKKVTVRGEPDRPSPIFTYLNLALPLFLIMIAWYFLARKQVAGEEGESSFARDRVARLSPGVRQVTFRDIAGIPEAKDELLEIVDFLQKPNKYNNLGAVIPRGILFQGPPGTGKTLLARAIAGEAGVPFYSISGSDFVEMFVGVGASRVRDLFREAKKNAPCIIFIDEIDAVGGLRTMGTATSGQDERGQTLNALLVEMDGFASDETVIVLAATNRPDILDPALLRPGRFDRQISILPPDVKGRFEILETHARRVKLSEGVDLMEVAKGTPGFTGAELKNLVNEAALIAGRERKKAIDLHDFEAARDRILMGVERKGMIISEQDRRTMAYHEAGHAILTKFLPETDPLHKITIIPRGRALGHTQQLPLNDRHAYTSEYLRSRIIMLMGGRVAEEICLDQQTSGAEDDLQQAVAIAEKMVCKWGMNEVVGHVSYDRGEATFLGERQGRTEYSEETARCIDREMKKLLEDCVAEAREILTREKDFLESLANLLLQDETLDREDMEIIYECTLEKREKKRSREAPSCMRRKAGVSAETG